MPTVSMTVNGKAVSGTVEGRTLLVQFLREHLGLTGTHVGCDTSQCGCCTIHLNGKGVKSCAVLALSCEGANIVTIAPGCWRGLGCCAAATTPAATNVNRNQNRISSAAMPEPAEPAPAAQSAEEVTRALASLATLRDSDAITPEDYEAKKQELLDRI